MDLSVSDVEESKSVLSSGYIEGAVIKHGIGISESIGSSAKSVCYERLRGAGNREVNILEGEGHILILNVIVRSGCIARPRVKS